MRPIIAPLAVLLLTAPAHAWQAGQDGAICTLSHSEAGVDIVLTHDPSMPLYTITATGPLPLDAAPVFSIAFLGGEEIVISTDRHTLSADGRAISVADRGFGNVLNGLSRNTSASFVIGGTTLSVSLEGAAPEVAAFEACGAVPSV